MMTPRDFFGLCSSNRPAAIDYLQSSISLDLEYARDLVSYCTPSGHTLGYLVTVDGDHTLGRLIDAALQFRPRDWMTPRPSGNSPFITAIMNGHSQIVRLKCIEERITKDHLIMTVDHNNEDMIEAISEVCMRKPLFSTHNKFNPYTSRSFQGQSDLKECLLCMGVYVSLAHFNAKSLRIFLNAHRHFRGERCCMTDLHGERDHQNGMKIDLLTKMIESVLYDTLSLWRRTNPHSRDREGCINVLLEYGADLTFTKLKQAGVYMPIYDVIGVCSEDMSIRMIDKIASLHLGGRYVRTIVGNNLIDHAMQTKRFGVVVHLLKMGVDPRVESTSQFHSLHEFRNALMCGLVMDFRSSRMNRLSNMINNISGGTVTDAHMHAMDMMMYASANQQLPHHIKTAKVRCHVRTFHQRLTLTKLSYFKIKQFN